MKLRRSDVRGSRRHVLDWVEMPGFLAELNAMLDPTGAVVSPQDHWMPKGWSRPTEARLGTFGPTALPDFVAWRELTRWWLRHPAGANTPNWDFASSCTIGQHRGLLLVEAKAHSFEIGMSGKTIRRHASLKSRENHDRICEAIAEASSGLAAVLPGTAFSASRGYQLANRLAHVWWLASHGLPIVLIYLAFLNDYRMQDLGEPIQDLADWRSWFSQHAQAVLPDDALERWISCGLGRMYIGLRARDMPKGYRGAATEPRSV